MPFEELLRQVHFEYTALQSKYDELLWENNALKGRLAQFQRIGCWTTQYDTETVSARSCRHVQAEQIHAAQPQEEASPNPEKQARVSTTSALGEKDFAHVRSGTRYADADEDTSLRGKTSRLLKQPWLEGLLAFVVIVNIAAMWISADHRATGAAEMKWIEIVDILFLIVYFIEFGLRCFAIGLTVFQQRWNLFDLAVIILDVICLTVGAVFDQWPAVNVKMFRLFRLLRLARILKIFRYSRELQLLIDGFVGATRALTYAVILLWLVMILWAFVFVEFVNPIVKDMTQRGSFDSCPQCQKAFSSIFFAHLTLLQTIVAGDSWGQMAFTIIMDDPMAMPVFAGSLITIQLGLLNLIFTVIVDAAHEHRKKDERLIAEEKEREFSNLFDDLLALCKQLDVDKSGDISVGEFVRGFQDDATFANKLASLDITEDEIFTVFKCADTDRSGSVSYIEFVNTFSKLQRQDYKTTLFFLKGYVTDIRHKTKAIERAVLELRSQANTVPIPKACIEIEDPIPRMCKDIEEPEADQKPEADNRFFFTSEEPMRMETKSLPFGASTARTSY